MVPSIFQAVMDQIFQGLPVWMILVAGSSKEEHDEYLGQVLKCLEKRGISSVTKV